MGVIVRGDSTLPLEIPRNLLQPAMGYAIDMGCWLQWVYVGSTRTKSGTFLSFLPRLDKNHATLTKFSRSDPAQCRLWQQHL
jgi:hypothetical protein